ncbi:MAG: iron ABC transporter [Desulfobacteraceae bacterium]|nr:MAG: iron ABC transporter [Desulfobacteraceae bacterium]
MEWTSLDTWIVVTGMLSAMACALLGNYLVLRRMSMMGDAISHAVLPGLALAFLIAGNRDSITMLIGATAIGVVTSLLIQGVSRLSGLDRGASMGVIFTTLFALGLILIRQAADHVDLDPGCVLYGAIELAPLDVYALFGFEIPRAAVTSGSMLLINAAFVLAFYKELKITSFDPALATTIGINADAMHYVLMTLVAATTIASFESVGSILVIAMLIVPAAAAHLLTDRLSLMLAISLIIAVLSAVLGHLGAITIPPWFGFRDTSTAGMMAVSSGFLFTLIFLFAPRYGVTSRILNQALLTLQITRDDILGLLYRFRELAPADAPPIRMENFREALKTGIAARIAVFNLIRRNLVRRIGDGFCLTDSGVEAGIRLIRSHRLWESYLCHKMGFCPEDVHYTAHRLEHFTDEKMQARLEEEAGRPEKSPHDRKIPE